jgi:hypothetical protein
VIRVRLLKLVVQPVFVVDDGESLKELPAQAATITAADWPQFGDKLERSRATLEREANSGKMNGREAGDEAASGEDREPGVASGGYPA